MGVQDSSAGAVLRLRSQLCCQQCFHRDCDYCSPQGNPFWKQQEELVACEVGRAPVQTSLCAALWLEPLLISSSIYVPAGQKLLSTGL